MPSTHSEIPTVKALLRSEYLHDMNMSYYSEYSKVEIIAISSYPGHAPTFTALIDGASLFHYLPINAFATKIVEPLSLKQSCYFNCPTPDVGVSVLTVPDQCNVFDHNRKLLGVAKYLMTFDWYQDNQLCHMVEMQSGHLILVPSHKLSFSLDEKSLPRYKKLHSIWKV